MAAATPIKAFFGSLRRAGASAGLATGDWSLAGASVRRAAGISTWLAPGRPHRYFGFRDQGEVDGLGGPLGGIRPAGAHQPAGERGNFVVFDALRLHFPLHKLSDLPY